MFRSLKRPLRSTGDIVCSYSGDGSDGFFELTAPGTSKPAFDGESDIPPSDPRSPKWHPMRKSRWDAEVTGSEATMSCIEYGVPQIGNRITVTSKSGEVLSEETVDSGGYSTYDLMVRALCVLARLLPLPIADFPRLHRCWRSARTSGSWRRAGSATPTRSRTPATSP